MSIANRMPSENRILSTLPRAEYRRLRPSLEHVGLNENEVVYSPGNGIKYIYFPEDAIVSQLLNVDGRRTVEVAMEGNEAAVGFATSLGGESSCNLSVVRDAGTAMRLEVRVLNGPAERGGRLQGLLNRYVHAFVTQVAQAAVCSRFHKIDMRLARWLLMSQDRLSSPELRATQQSIANMLGVRRSSVTTAASTLHKHKVIDYSRGRIEILDQRRLRAASCSCYGIIKRQYDSFLD
jgi:CRP-like cAMP-binding protein